jgi:hypothetical protein
VASGISEFELVDKIIEKPMLISQPIIETPMLISQPTWMLSEPTF